MKDIKWEGAPTATAVWIQDNDTVNCSDFSGWFDDINDDGWYYECGSGSYVSNRNSDMFSVHSRPEQPTKADEWVPVVGEECEVKYFHESECKWEKCFVIGSTKDNKCLVINVYNDDSLHFAFKQSGSLEFRPLKTAEEKKRESFMCLANKATNADGKDHTIVDLFNDLFAAGFTAPEGGE